jgi:hypothetical protein
MRSETTNITKPHDGDCTLVIMAKAVRAGAVKTRLGACLPADAIAGLYRCLLEDTPYPSR